MANYRLNYFPARGAAEVTRIMFAEADVKYEDNRVSGEAWEALKSKSPQGKMPFLEVLGTGEVIPQSKAIARYAARKYGFYGKDNSEATKIDVIVDTLQDINTAVITMYFEKDEAKKTEMTEKLKTDTLPVYLASLEKVTSDKDFMIGSAKLTLADFSFIAQIDGLEGMFPDCLKDYPKMNALKKKIRGQPNVAKWIKERPDTAF